MTNLLPEKTRTRLLRLHLYRFVSFVSFALAALAVLFMLALLPAYLALHAERATLAQASPPSSLSDEERVDRTEGARVKTMLSDLAIAAPATSTISSAVSATLSLKPQGVFIDRISFSPHMGLIVAGRASGRDAIQGFRTALLSDTERVAAVSVPVASLLGAEEGRFTITITPR